MKRISTQELRIGNYVEYNTRIAKVCEIQKAFFYCESDGVEFFTRDQLEPGAKPIPLTEEWLLKFGFDKYKYGHHSYRKKSFIIEEGLLKNSPYDFRKRISKDTSLGLTYIKHVHQLQNLYFALTGEELTLQQ